MANRFTAFELAYGDSQAGVLQDLNDGWGRCAVCSLKCQKNRFGKPFDHFATAGHMDAVGWCKRKIEAGVSVATNLVVVEQVMVSARQDGQCGTSIITRPPDSTQPSVNTQPLRQQIKAVRENGHVSYLDDYQHARQTIDYFAEQYVARIIQIHGLNAYERMLCHRLAHSHEIAHFSIGEQNNQRIFCIQHRGNQHDKRV
jgi:hypothetical protein